MEHNTILLILTLAVVAFAADVASSLVVDGRRIGDPHQGPIEDAEFNDVVSLDLVEEREHEQHRDLKSKFLGGLQMTISNPSSSQTNPSIPSPFSTTDPGTKSIQKFQTYLLGKNRSWGNMFDIEAKKSLTITQLYIHTSSKIYVHFEIWTKSGTHEGFESIKSSWTLWAKGYTIGRGEGTITPLPRYVFGDGVPIEKGQRRAFYISLGEPYLKYDNGKFNSRNSDLIVHNGKAVGKNKFGRTFQPRLWNGAVEYTLDNYEDLNSNVRTDQELFVTLAGRTGSYGIQFDIFAKQDIVINMFSIHILQGDFDLAIYTKENSHVNYEESFDGWTNILPLTSLKGQGQMHVTPLPENSMDPVYIPAGTTQAFFISSSNPNLRYSKANSDVGSSYSENGDLTVMVGTGIGGFPHGRLFSPRVFNGVVHYEVVDEPPVLSSSGKSTVMPTTKELETTMKGGSGSFGTIFSVVASSKMVTVMGMKLRIATLSQAALVEIYTKKGPFQGFEYDIKSWNRVYFGIIQTTEEGKPTPLPTPNSFVPVPIEAGATQSFYVTLNKKKLVYSRGNTAGAPFASNGDLSVLEGVGITDYPFKGKLYSPRLFNGILQYQTSGTASTSNSPSYGLTPLSTTVPTPSPTFSLNHIFQLASSFRGDNGNFGNMVDIICKRDVTLRTLSVHTSSTEEVDVVVMGKEGSFRGTKNDKSEWKTFFNSEVSGNGYLKETLLPSEDFDAFEMCAGKTYSLYITLLEKKIRYTNFVSGRDKNIENDHIMINLEDSVGVGKYPFGKVYEDRMWDGVLHYTNGVTSCSPVISPLPQSSSDTTFNSQPNAAPSSQTFSTSSISPSVTPNLFSSSDKLSMYPAGSLPTSSASPSSFTSYWTPGALSRAPSGDPTTSPSFVPSTEPTAMLSHSPSQEQFLELVTDFRGDKLSNGVMFNIKATKGMTLRSMALHISSKKEEHVEVFLRKGRYQGYENKPEYWEQVFASSVKGMGYMVKTVLPRDEFTRTKLCPNESIGIYITMKKKYLWHSLIPVDVSNQDLILDLSVGSSVSGYGFDEENIFKGRRTWNGAIYYDLDAQCSPTISPSPSLSPSKLRSDYPSVMPIFVPSDQPSTKPSLLPSISPSIQQSMTPSFDPSIVPTYWPSSIPSTDPTFAHSNIPTSSPSRFPSLNPTSTPTSIPSALPTSPPTLSPSKRPSSVPTLSHSSLPSLVPTLTSSSVPSIIPTNHPSETPSASPTLSDKTIKFAIASSISLDFDLLDPNSPQSKALEWLVEDKELAKDENYLSQRYTMGVLFYSLGGPKSNIHPDWGSNKTHCSWKFVQCVNGDVVEIEIDPESSGKIDGTLPYEIQEIEKLEYLTIQNSKLKGTIPTEIGTLTGLKHVNLSGNKLVGQVMTEFGKLTGLEELSLSRNDLTGEIPSELGKLTNMIGQLSLHSNSLNGTIPTELGRLTLLGDLMLQNNALTGSLPSHISALTDLKHMLLEGNNLVGSISSDISSITNLQYLTFKGNQMTGTIPTELGQLTELRYIVFNSNKFSSTIPSELGNLKKLEKGYFFLNELTGTMPLEICANRNNTSPSGRISVLQVDCVIYCTCCTHCF